jgi:putative isomerase
MMKKKIIYALCLVTWISWSCTNETSISTKAPAYSYLDISKNILDYRITPKDKFDKSGLMFSDQGAWFAYSLADPTNKQPGFSGPFLMTQQNGVWISASFTTMKLKANGKPIDFIVKEQVSYSSHLTQNFTSDLMDITQQLTFQNGHTALIQIEILNKGNEAIALELNWENSPLLADGISFSVNENQLQISSAQSDAEGYLLFPEGVTISLKDSINYQANSTIELAPKSTQKIELSQTFIFPEYDWKQEKESITRIDFDSVLTHRKAEKNEQLRSLITQRKSQFQEKQYAEVLAKAHLTLQNNWRIPAGEINHEGLFPSYHYRWFNGFWSWDSWKHAVGLSYYDTKLAQNQMKLMFDFQLENGFIVDCVFRDTTIEKHNYRDTKPPLSAWAVAKIYKQDRDIELVMNLYPKLKKYHEWWYANRDHDQDGICEYGSTDGSLVAAKWESGMDNAIRFDNAQIVKNGEGAYSINQESVDLNAYLYAEKRYLVQLATALKITKDSATFAQEAVELKIKIQQQFFDENDGWFYDTDLAGTTFIKGEGSEGWTALWAKAATQKQAEAVKNKMMDSTKFYTKVPFQTMSADHPKFDPLKGYWRGPNWLDQSYFGVKGLRNYGCNAEADHATIQILTGTEGILGKGKAIRENYHPLTGEGLHAHNFSWSAAHIIMLLVEE